ncbi:hypothetical protein SDC9_182250 [bioreactor metagenome]|uniref:Uncharacterized protein n=1 Tax=bioreactor metagenome TaxID=1076179 RepID=A0A645H8C6_9ZZZZ
MRGRHGRFGFRIGNRRMRPGCGWSDFCKAFVVFEDRHRAAGFFEHFDGTRAQGFEGFARAGGRQRAHDDHRHGPVFHEQAQESKPIHPRHLDIQCDDVRLQLQHLVPGHVRVHGGADHFDIREVR